MNKEREKMVLKILAIIVALILAPIVIIMAFVPKMYMLGSEHIGDLFVLYEGQKNGLVRSSAYKTDNTIFFERFYPNLEEARRGTRMSLNVLTKILRR
jgi:hypothetical protein